MMAVEKLTRNQIHEKLMICAYQYLFYLSFNEKEDLKDLLEGSFDLPLSEIDEFSRNCFKEFVNHLPEIVDGIKPLLSKGWTFERLQFIEQAILCLGYTEYKYMETPKPVIINVCVKLAQKYADDDSYKFINGVLEHI